MEPAEAINLLSNDSFNYPQPQQWADLGCGSGTFTLALAGLLKPQSSIHAIDNNEQALKQIPAQHNKVLIEKIRADFNQPGISFTGLNGILMANSLHYIKDKDSFIQKSGEWLKEDGSFLLVEYDMTQSNQWVPYPLSFSSAEKLFYKAGFSTIRKLAEIDSRFRRAKLYSLLIQQRGKK
jgi:ubiquinone/menaquinone biosynthesis C-methylase UbiE